MTIATNWNPEDATDQVYRSLLGHWVAVCYVCGFETERPDEARARLALACHYCREVA